VAEIPAGRVMTYGDIAACCGVAYAARIVGGFGAFWAVRIAMASGS